MCGDDDVLIAPLRVLVIGSLHSSIDNLESDEINSRSQITFVLWHSVCRLTGLRGWCQQLLTGLFYALRLIFQSRFFFFFQKCLICHVELLVESPVERRQFRRSTTNESTVGDRHDLNGRRSTWSQPEPTARAETAPSRCHAGDITHTSLSRLTGHVYVVCSLWFIP
jgi:hypothetical protein